MRTALAWALGVLFTLPLGACLERYESITISPDGAAVLRAEFKGDVGDLSSENGGDAVPAPGGAWLVSEQVDREDPKKTTRTAELSVAPGQSFPCTYLQTPGDPRADRVLNFPTTVKVLRAAADDKGVTHTYFDFKRTYLRRDDARYTLTQRLLEKDGALKALKDRAPETLADDDRIALVNALARIELGKCLEYADAGIAAVGDRWPQEIGLLVRRSLVDHVKGFDPKPLAALLGEKQSEARDAKIADFSRGFHDSMREAVVKYMGALGLSKESQAAFMAGATAEADRRGVTEDLADEKWEVRVTLPGTIVAHNGDRVEGNTVIWSFGAEHIMDRDEALMASSRIDEPAR